MKSSLILALALLILPALLLSGCAQSPPPSPAPSITNASNATKGYVHEHADFGIFVNGQMVNLSDTVFMTEKGSDANTSCAASGVVAHLHDNIGTIAHKHAPGLTWGYFLSTLGIQLDGSCLTLYNGSTYCGHPEAVGIASPQLAYWVNGTPVDDLANYPIHNLDKVVIAYGPANATGWPALSSAVPNLAQFQSTGEGCGSEAGGAETPLAPTSMPFNTDLFSRAYFDSAIKLNANQSLDASDFNALFTSASGAPPAAIYDLEAAQWLTEHNLSMHADHALSYAYALAAQNTAIACMPHEAEHIQYYLNANDTDIAGPAILRLQYDVMPAYLSKIESGANASVDYAAASGQLPEVLRQVRALSASAAVGDYYGSSIRSALDYLQSLPC